MHKVFYISMVLTFSCLIASAYYAEKDEEYAPHAHRWLMRGVLVFLAGTIAAMLFVTKHVTNCY